MMTSEHVQEVIEFMRRERGRKKTTEEIVKELQEVGLFDSNGNYPAHYRNLGEWIDECNPKIKEARKALAKVK